MPDLTKNFPFVTGGPVRFDSPVYIQREVEKFIFRYVQANKYVTIVGPRQVGKTSILQRIQYIVETQFGFASALLDLSTFNSSGMSATEWKAEFCARLIEQLSHFLKEDFTDYEIPNTGTELRQLLADLSEKIDASTILILLDEANAVPTHISDPFYSTIRWIFTDRTAYRSVKALQKYNFVFAGVFEPARLIKNSQNSPFNVSEVIRLPDFSLIELAQLGTPIDSIKIPASVIEKIYEWTGGQPYLSQKLFAGLGNEIQSGLSSINNFTIDNIGKRLLGTDNVEHVAKLSMQDQSLYSILIQILNGDQVPFSRANQSIARLELIGAIRESDEGICEIRNKVYELALQRAFEGLQDIKNYQNENDIPAEERIVEQITPNTLLDILVAYFDEADLREICFIMSTTFPELSQLDFENLQGEEKRSKALSLIQYCWKRGYLNELAKYLYDERPNIKDWHV